MLPSNHIISTCIVLTHWMIDYWAQVPQHIVECEGSCSSGFSTVFTRYHRLQPSEYCMKKKRRKAHDVSYPFSKFHITQYTQVTTTTWRLIKIDHFGSLYLKSSFEQPWSLKAVILLWYWALLSSCARVLLMNKSAARLRCINLVIGA